MGVFSKQIQKNINNVLNLLFLVAAVLLVTITPIAKLVIGNALIQLLIFIPIVHIPAYFTNKMSYVDIAWPSGLIAMAIYAHVNATGQEHRALCFVFVYFMMGARMLYEGISHGAQNGFILEEDLPRYQYAKTRHLRKRSEKTWWIQIQIEIF